MPFRETPFLTCNVLFKIYVSANLEKSSGGASQRYDTILSEDVLSTHNVKMFALGTLH